MHLIRSLKNVKIDRKLCLTIGNFDGFHIGHQEIIKKVKNIADSENMASAILSFEPHPRKFFKKEQNANFRINEVSQKIKFIKDYAIDYAIILNFNEKFSQITATEFLKEVIINKLNVKNLIIGYDFVFGKNRNGDIDFLKKNQEKYDFKLTKINPFKKNHEICSSSLIREKISNSQIKEANELLTKNFTINGIVLHGNKLAKKIGYKTANFKAKSYIIKPLYGVYKSKTFIPHLNKTYDSITNFGIRPTILKNNQEFYETHIFDFKGDLYDKKISVELLSFIRKEQKFNSIDELTRQIKRDIAFAVNHLS